jgi:hypothetical protein
MKLRGAVHFSGTPSICGWQRGGAQVGFDPGGGGMIRQEARKQVAKQVVNVVNPRLVMYTHSCSLAATILVLNYVIIIILAFVLKDDCSETSVVDRSLPVTFGDFVTYEEFINITLSREGVVSSGTTTTTTTVSGCVKRNSAVLVAPYMSDICANTCNYASDGDCDDGGPGSEFQFGSSNMLSAACALGSDCVDCGPRVRPTTYAGTGITTDVPCWNQYVPCSNRTGTPTSPAIRPSGSATTEFQAVAGFTIIPGGLPCGWYKSDDARNVGGDSYRAEMGYTKADRFPWCSPADEDFAIERYRSMSNLSAMDGTRVNLAISCGLNKMNRYPVTPAGVFSPNLSPSPGELSAGTLTSFTTHWNLTVITTTKVCPKFSATFSSAFAYTAQIEIVITLVLIYLFKKIALIADNKDVIDIGTDGIITKEKALELTKGNAQIADGGIRAQRA